MPGVWLGDDTAGIRVILVLRLFIVVEGVGQIVHLVYECIVQVGGAVPLRPGDGRLLCEKFGGRIRGGLFLVGVANCWVFSLIVVIQWPSQKMSRK